MNKPEFAASQFADEWALNSQTERMLTALLKEWRAIGRREGLEEAARIVDEEYRGQGGTRHYTENTLLQIAGAIRQAGEGDRGPCPVCGSGDWSCGH